VIRETCDFETARLRVGDWHSVSFGPRRDLAVVVAEMLTPAATRSLPPVWHGDYSLDRAREWIAERDEESVTLLATDRESGEALGLVIVFEVDGADDGGGVDLRLGYLFSESAWGRGLATELVEGFVGWCRAQPSIRSITGGVASDNVASARVLTKNGFTATGSPRQGEQIYELRLRS